MVKLNNEEMQEAKIKIVDMIGKTYPDFTVMDFIEISANILSTTIATVVGKRNGLIFSQRFKNFLNAQMEHADNGEYGYVIEEDYKNE